MSHLPGYPGYRRRLNDPTIIPITMAALFKERLSSPRAEQTAARRRRARQTAPVRARGEREKAGAEEEVEVE